jgi:hypothetical protein
MLSVQEVHFYNNLVEKNEVKNLIVCPFVKEDIVVTKVDEDDKPYFFCIGCRTTFYLTKDIQEIIKLTIDKFISRI